ncbi:MAG: 4-oxalocrotonate tautomerase [Eubacteriaceae bacterium]|jgi:4-oxalocrotonate tautomerase|nr:4-oxalocrotonate tautomerase [Eubacteriaceae bacterium]
MPYIAIKCYPKDEETKKQVVEKINQIIMEAWDCPEEAISISIEEYPPEDWEEKVEKSEIDPKKDKMMILDGEKLYKDV